MNNIVNNNLNPSVTELSDMLSIAPNPNTDATARDSFAIFKSFVEILAEQVKVVTHKDNMSTFSKKDIKDLDYLGRNFCRWVEKYVDYSTNMHLLEGCSSESFAVLIDFSTDIVFDLSDYIYLTAEVPVRLRRLVLGVLDIATETDQRLSNLN